MRLEQYNVAGELDSLSVYRPDKDICWSALPASGTLYESAFPRDPVFAAFVDTLFAWNDEGSEIIDGRECRRYVGTPQSASAGQSHEVIYIEAANGLPVRHITYDVLGRPARSELRSAFNLKPQAPSLFERPKEYSVVRSYAVATD